MHPERRRASRYQFIADAEVFDLASEVKLQARTGDLGLGGCFLGMLNPSPEGTEVRVTIFHAAITFTSLAKVIFVFPNMGMGVVFTSVEGNQLPVLQEWLSELAIARQLVRLRNVAIPRPEDLQQGNRRARLRRLLVTTF